MSDLSLTAGVAADPEVAAAANGRGKPSPAPPVVQIDDSSVATAYANFFRVTGGAEELILDFGLDSQLRPVGNATVKVSQRTVVNFFTAKRLIAALSAAVQRHEQAFGVLETDVAKRARSK